ncbi:MAG: ribonuclease-3 [Halioglobus sp.]|jgi:ribonuclease-3
MSNLDRLQRALSYEFSDSALLNLALTHRSMGGKNNERLEFLGDSIVNHVVAEALYKKFPEADEGAMSRMRAALVKGDTLAEIAIEIDLGDYLLLGQGERKSGGRRRGSILADAFEAVAGAILLDSSVERCRSCMLQLFKSRLDALQDMSGEKDAKTLLQEYLQGNQKPLPTYTLVKVDGGDHNPEFLVNCALAKPERSFEGAGSSRRRAEQKAAEMALSKVNPSGK